MTDKNEGWIQYQKLVLSELRRHGDALNNLEKHLSKIEVEIAMLKVKAGLWGAFGGSIPIFIIYAMDHLKK